MDSANTRRATSADPNLTKKWHLTDYLTSIGMRQDDAVAWVRARRQGRSFKVDASDAAGDHLDNVWKRNIQEGKALSQLQDTGNIRQELIFATLCICGVLCWMYVIVLVMVNPDSVSWPLAAWLPKWVRLDYFGEAGFFASFLFGILWARLRHGSLARRNEMPLRGGV